MAADIEQRLISEAWAALNAGPPGEALVTGDPGHLPSRFAVEETAIACVAVALLAAGHLHGRASQEASPQVSVDREHVAAAVRSERSFRRGDQHAGAGFAPLSRFWRTSDGWVRTHANYPWHRDALLEALETPADPDAIAAVMVQLPSEEVETRVFAAGGIAAAVRSFDAWRAHPQGHALAAQPLIGTQTIGDAAPRERAVGGLPAERVRVLDLTRVIAGPVCTRFLGALGADVMRLDPPGHPDMAAGSVADTLLGKRSAMVDFGTADGAATLHRLLDGADVVVCGYRPGALERFGLGAEALADRHPGLVIVVLDAWGHRGPWAGRRGFDSVVQAPTGIAHGESATGDEPGALPCQLLDHGTGYLAAAAALDGLRHQRATGATHVRRLSLARTAMWLTSAPTSTPMSGEPVASPGTPPWLVALDSRDGPVTAVAPPGALGERSLRWPSPLTGYGTDAPTWLSR
ncbi:MAG: CoA transferase [Acidimicrobiales bacterium]